MFVQGRNSKWILIRVAARFFSGVPHPHLLGDRCPDHFTPLGTGLAEHAGHRSNRLSSPMLISQYESPDEFALKVLSALALLFVAYLLRLQFKGIRNRIRRSAGDPRSGLVQAVTVLQRKNPAATTAAVERRPEKFSQMPVVPRRDGVAKIWTEPAVTAAFRPEWN
jgi:hypothetical protein